MYFEQREKKRSFYWLYLVLFVAFIIWVMLDEGPSDEHYPLVIELTLPKE